MIKSSIGKLDVYYDPVDMAQQSGFELLDFQSQDALLLKDMPFHHKDPFDRMLIAQAIANKYHLMTEDSKFSAYECRLL
jgi:PIN domain nuclease of toxin-antitoxin system